MKAIRYSYSVIRYVHDAGTGESLNVGVVVHAPDVPFFDVQVQPMSLDMVKPDSIQRKAAQWAGYGTGLDRVPDLDCLYFLLGRPRIESNLKAYERARNLLHQMPVKHELVEEHEAEKFAADFAADLRRHGVELSG